jgi:hypothetical protein
LPKKVTRKAAMASVNALIEKLLESPPAGVAEAGEILEQLSHLGNT